MDQLWEGRKDLPIGDVLQNEHSPDAAINVLVQLKLDAGN